GQLWTVAFTGFVPGFGYMIGENSILNVPRRSVPRTGVDAGSVAVGGSYTGVYPRKSPGGWQIIGHTDCVMWDSSRPEPALVGPGTTVSYRAVRERLSVAQDVRLDSADPPQDPAASNAGPALRVIRSMPLTLIQDLGRPGHSAIGVTRSGALDQGSLRRANRLVGNAPEAAALEIVDGGLTVEAVGDQVVAVAGAPAGLHVLSGTTSRTPPLAAPFALLDGDVLKMGPAAAGVRSYLAVRGGIEVPGVLGSRSSDTLSALGPAPLTAGQLVRVGPEPRQAVGTPESQPGFPDGQPVELEITPGPREDWFTPGALDSLCSQAWTVSNDSNRIGLRLTGTALERSRLGELPSEGTIRGVIQVPPSGQPVVFLADHPVTGGYPVIAVVTHTDLDKAAQVPPGGTIRFRLAPSPKKDSSLHA
ncbi:MAG: urea amidolyase, partial [Pseudarthrobacter sp.]|nr:urea amidolyase [Pseudarthrobacter sp.]